MLISADFLASDFNDKDYYPSGNGFNNDFEIQEDGKVVLDHASGLMWQQSGSHTPYKNFEEVNAYIRHLNIWLFESFDHFYFPGNLGKYV